MPKIRSYGNPPYQIVILHGGPGALGEVAPVARELGKDYGVLEPFQDAHSIEGQVKELYDELQEKAAFPIILIGWSWGAWLAIIFTVQYPELVKKLILISSGPFKEKYADEIKQKRLSRLNENEQKHLTLLFEQLKSKDLSSLNKLERLISKADSFNPLPYSSEIVEFQPQTFAKVWAEASELRKSGKLLSLLKNIKCPIIAMHGDYDPHPWEGIKIPLLENTPNAQFILLEKCGHKPWIEREAKNQFYQILKQKLEDE